MLRMPGAALRDGARLTLPCGATVDPRSSFQIVLDNGTDVSAYAENNAFGFMPAFGFSGTSPRSYVLHPKPLAADRLRDNPCAPAMARDAHLTRCSGFGSPSSFFAASRHQLAHYVTGPDGVPRQDFVVADLHAAVDSLFFLPPPDAPGGSITLMLNDHGTTYRAFIDVPRG
jgi:hypothetical protein